MKKSHLKHALIAVLTISFLAACKKGENDPFLSLKSRNSRITGTWKLTSQTTSETYVESFNGSSTTDVFSTTYDGTTLYVNDGGSSNSTSYSQTIEINKDGTYKMTRIEDGSTYQNNGNWWWIDSKKKKVRIAFDDDWGSLYIDRLTNKEMVLTIDESYSSSESGYSSSTTSTAKYTFEKE
ncbi:MAG: hypothetical protein EP333_07595 [Bacteroidetes bacterium]|nr:MAG: hypothetical protein EP333_07595 [Bacteroidota bacterium]